MFIIKFAAWQNKAALTSIGIIVHSVFMLALVVLVNTAAIPNDPTTCIYGLTIDYSIIYGLISDGCLIPDICILDVAIGPAGSAYI